MKKDGESKLRKFIEGVRDERSELRSDEPGHDDDETSLSDMDARELLRCALLETAGLQGKQALSLDVISPLILADDDDPKSLLAGEFMGDFGGFLSEELRSSDFNLGYEAATAWLERGLPGVASQRGCKWRDRLCPRSRPAGRSGQTGRSGTR